MMRLIVRAWREMTDGIRAGAAKWEQRLAASEMGNPQLWLDGYRLMTQYRYSIALVYGPEVGWRIRAIFSWMRIVRAANVRQAAHGA